MSGAVWRFRNEANRAVFLAHPEIYAPRFGGYDAVDVARSRAVAGRAQLWLISGERLYLFSREENRNAFAADPEGIRKQADGKWPALVETLSGY
jgi:YHS domain-containing protein